MIFTRVDELSDAESYSILGGEGEDVCRGERWRGGCKRESREARRIKNINAKRTFIATHQIMMKFLRVNKVVLEEHLKLSYHV